MGLPIAVDDLGHTFQSDAGPVEAIERFDFEIDAGDVVTMVGPTGCGKSTILNVILGVLTPTEGEVRIGGRRPYEEFDSFRGQIAAVFQEDRLLPWRTAFENANLGLEALDLPESECRSRVAEWFDTLGLEGYEEAYPTELSGGMRQRVGLARAYAVDPEVLLLDEAFGHLDEVTATALRADFLDLIESGPGRKTTFFITHDIDEALTVGDRVLVSRSPGYVIEDIDVPPAITEDVTLREEYKDRILTALA